MPGIAPVAKRELEGFAGIARVELRAKLPGEPRGFQRREHSHFLKNPVVIRQQRFADVKSRKPFFLEQEHPFSAPREICRGCAASGTAANNDGVVNSLGHDYKEPQNGSTGKSVSYTHLTLPTKRI